MNEKDIKVKGPFDWCFPYDEEEKMITVNMSVEMFQKLLDSWYIEYAEIR